MKRLRGEKEALQIMSAVDIVEEAGFIAIETANADETFTTDSCIETARFVADAFAGTDVCRQSRLLYIGSAD